MATTAALDSKYPGESIATRQADLINLLSAYRTQGVVRGIGNEFVVTQRSAGANMSIDVGSGEYVLQASRVLSGA